jgi:hypothetical protein
MKYIPYEDAQRKLRLYPDRYQITTASDKPGMVLLARIRIAKKKTITLRSTHSAPGGR